MGDTGDLYEFSSPPTVPRERAPDILVKFQAVSSNNPCLLAKSYKLNSNTKVLDVRRKIQADFDQVFENGFVFLCKNTEILTSRETTLTLKDVLPKAGLGKPFKYRHEKPFHYVSGVPYFHNKVQQMKNSFQYPPDVSYKELPFDKDGRFHMVPCIGLLFLCDASGVSHWNPRALRQRLDAHSTFGFTFIPSDITSARADVNESLIEELNQYAAVAGLDNKQQTEDSAQADKQFKENFEFCKQKIENLLKTSRLNEEKLKDWRLATPLHYAAQTGQLKMCQFLCMRFDKSKLLYEKDMHGRTPLHCALSRTGVKSTRKHLKVVAYLLTYITDPGILSSYDGNGLNCYTMIMSLKKDQTIFLMKLLDPDLIDQKLVLHFCCCALQYKELSQAARYCESVAVVKPTFIRPPLHLAAEFGNVEIITTLLNGHHRVLDRDPDGNLPFHYACNCGKAEFIKLLYHKDMQSKDLEKGVRLALFGKKFNVMGKIAEVALKIEIQPDLRQMLLIQAERNLKKHGKSILGCLMKSPDEKRDEYILSLSPFVSQAASVGLTELLQELLKLCPSTYSDVMSRTPLHEAVQGASSFKNGKMKTSKRHDNCLHAFKILHQETKSLKCVDWRGSTPLHYACKGGSIEFVKFMLSEKDLEFASMKDSVGRTPLLVAAHYQTGRKTLEFMINTHLEHLGPYAVDAHGKSILHYIGYMKSGVVDVLLRKMKNLKKTSPEPYKPKQIHLPQSIRNKLVSHTKGKSLQFISQTQDGSRQCRYCDEVLQQENGLHFCQVLFQTLPENDSLCPLQTLIVMNKPDVLKKVIKEMPKLLEGDKGLEATICAAKMWRRHCAEVLLKGVRKSKIYLDIYLLAALETKPTLHLVEKDPPSSHTPDRCRLANLSFTQDVGEAETQYLMVKDLINMGANPYYIPHQQGYGGPSVSRLTALERAIILENKTITELFLDQPKTSVRESFAVHLAAKAGNVEILEKLLLKLRKEQKKYGKTDTELTFISTLPNGILGAACVSEKPSFALFEAIYWIKPDIFKGTKLVTARLLGNSRPTMLHLLGIHDKLPLVLFMKKQHKNLSADEKERIVCFILQNGSYPAEMRIMKKSFIHPACILFSVAHMKRMWKVLAILLHKSGSTIWKCFFGANEEKIKCQSMKLQHSYIWHSDKEGLSLWDSLKQFASSPLEITSMFTNSGLRTLTTLDQYYKEQLLHNEFIQDQSLETDKTQTTNNIQNLFLQWIIPKLWIKPLKVLLSKHTSQRDCITKHINQNTKKDMWTPSFVSCETVSLTNLQSVKETIGKIWKHINLPVLHRLINVRKHALFKKEKTNYRSLAKTLRNILKCLQPAEEELPDIYLAVAFGDSELVDFIIRSRKDVIVHDQQNQMNLLDLAARKASLPMIKLLMKHNEVPTQKIVQYAGLSRKCFLVGHVMKSNETDPYLKDPFGQTWYRSDEEEDEVRLGLVKYICERLSNTVKDSSIGYTGILQKAAICHKWNLVDYLLGMGATDRCHWEVLKIVTPYRDTPDNKSGMYDDTATVIETCKSLQSILSYGPEDLALKAIRTLSNAKWNKQLLYITLAPAALSNKKQVVRFLLQEVLFSRSCPLGGSDVLEVLFTYRWDICHPHRSLSGITKYFSVFHSLCQNGDIDNVTLILRNLKCESIAFLDTLDAQKRSPLWCAAAHKHWKIAELLLLNGAAPDCYRAIPDLYVKKTGYSLLERKIKITSVKFFAGSRGIFSRGTADALQSKSNIFLHPEDLMKLKQKSENDAHIPLTKYEPKFIPREAMVKRVKYLMNMARIGKAYYESKHLRPFNKTIFHAAIIDGNITLLKEIASQPMFGVMMKTSEGTAAEIMALSSQNLKALKECRRHPEVMVHPVEAVRRGSQVIISLSGHTLREIFKLKNRKKSGESMTKKSQDSKQVCGDEMKLIVNSLYEALIRNYMEGQKLVHSSLARRDSLEDLAREVISILPLSVHQEIPNEFFIALALLSVPDVFSALAEKLKLSPTNTDMTSRYIFEGYTVTDLMILLSSQKEIKQLCECLDALASISVLHINDAVLMMLIKRNMTSVLRVIAESIYSKTPDVLLAKPWLDVFIHAAGKGDTALLKVLIKALTNESPSRLNSTVEKALCSSSSKGYSDIVEILTTFANKKGIIKALDLHTALKQASKYGRVQVVKQLLKLCHKLQMLSVDLLIKILKRTKFSGSRTFFQTVFDFAEEAFRNEKETYLTEVPTVLLQSAKHGHEHLCLYLLDKFPDVNLKQKSRGRDKEISAKGQKRKINQDNKDATTLHYACERGLRKLVLKILEKDAQLADIEDRDKRKPVQYAAVMGHVALLQEVSQMYGIKGTDKLVKHIRYFGSLRHCLINNAVRSSETASVPSIYPTHGRGRRQWTLENALKHKDEEAALSMFYAAEGPLCELMKTSYRRSNIIHEASKAGCKRFLLAVFKSFEKSPESLKGILLTEVDGCIPMALAVQSKSMECVKLLKDSHDTTEWTSSKSKETIFHFAAKANDVATLDLLLDNTDLQKILALNNSSMTAGLYSIALGHHQVTSRLYEKGFPQNPQHVSHTSVDYTCQECLLDQCIGWSKMYLTRQHVVHSTPRDIWERRAATGFTPSDGKTTHILERLMDYAHMSKNTTCLQNALMCMGYESSVETARLFLLQSKEKQLHKIYLCLSQGWESTVITILKYLDKREDANFYSHTLHSAIVNDFKEVVRYMIQEHPDLITDKELFGFTALEVAVSFQRNDIYDELLSKVPQDTVQGCFKNLPDIKISIPLYARWITGISHPGDETWLESVQESRFPDANCLMLYNSNIKLKEKLESTAVLDSMFPAKICEKVLSVDAESFKRGSPFPVSESWLMAVVASYLQNLKSTLEEVSDGQLEDVDVIEVSCLPSSNKVPFMEISGKTLRDRVMLDKSDTSTSKGPILVIKGSERLPNKLHRDSYFKKLVETDIIPEAEEMIADITGHKVKVKVEWSSFNAEHREEAKTTVYSLLAGRDPNSVLGGLTDVLRRCKDVCDDIQAHHDDTVLNSVQELFLPLKEIVVKHSSSITKAGKILFCLVDQSMPWFVNYNNGKLAYIASNFPLYSILKACHSVCVNLSFGIREFEMELEQRSCHLSSGKTKRTDKEPSKEKRRMEAHIDWKSFASLGDSTALSILGRNGIRLEMLRLAAGLKHLMWFTCKPKYFVLKNVPLSSQTELSIDDDTVTMAIYATRSHNAGWISTGLDIFSRLQEIEIKWMSQGTDYDNSGSLVNLLNIVKSFGLRISVPKEEKRWFEEISRKEIRQMTRPDTILQLYVDHSKYYLNPENSVDHQQISLKEDSVKEESPRASSETSDDEIPNVNSPSMGKGSMKEWIHKPWQLRNVPSRIRHTKGLAGELEECLLSCPGVWPVQEMDIIPGLWCWVTTAELQNGISYDKFLVKGQEKRDGTVRTFFKVMSKHDARKWDPNNVSGVWYHQSFDKKNDMNTVKRLQLMSFSGMICLVTDPETVQRLLLKIPSSIKMGLSRDDAKVDENTFFIQFGSYLNGFNFYDHLQSGRKKENVDNRALYDCWNRSSELGINVVIDITDIREAGFGYLVLEQIAEGTATSLEEFVHKNDLTSQYLCSDLLSSQGIILVGRNITEGKPTWTAGGSSSEGNGITIYPLSETDLYVSYERALDNLSKAVDKENPVFVRSVYTGVLNHAFGHKTAQNKKRTISKTLQDLSITGGSVVDVTFLEPTSEDIFISQAQTVADNIGNAFTFLASVSRSMREKMTAFKEVHIKKKNSGSVFNIANYHKGILTLFAVNKEIPVPLEDITKALLETSGAEITSLNGEVLNSNLVRFKPMNYKALCPTWGSNTIQMKVTDFLGKDLTVENLKHLKLKNIKAVVCTTGDLSDVVETTTNLTDDGQGIEIKYTLQLNNDSGVRRKIVSTSSINTVTVKLGEYNLFGPVRIRTRYRNPDGIVIGNSPNQILLTQKQSPTFVLFAEHEKTCWGTELPLTNDKYCVPGNCVENVYAFGTIFEVTYKAESGMGKFLYSISSAGWNTHRSLENIFAFQFSYPRQRVFIRARCKKCGSFLDLHTKVLSVPAGSYLEVVYKPSTK